MSQSQSIDERLSALDETVKTAPAAPDFPEVEPGTYQTIFREVRSFESKKGALYVVWRFEVDSSDPKFAGYDVDKIICLEPQVQSPHWDDDQLQRNIGFIKKDLGRFGEDFTSFRDIAPGAPIYDRMLDRPVELYVKDGGLKDDGSGEKWPNKVYINDVLGSKLTSDVTPQSMLDDVEPEPTEDKKSSDDIPF